MAKTNAVWGIDIGQCALKALRCSPHPTEPNLVVAEAFDYIEYPKILSQPDADPVQMVREALELFLSRNTVRGDRVAISVSGQSGLARFIKLPPVQSKKIPDIVKYEAKQQIPFSLDDVVWDYQQMVGGTVDEGFSLETEVGLFAMKRDQVFRALKPLDEVGIEVDFIQLAPLAIYNAMVYDQMQDLPGPDEYDPENPPESIVVLYPGTDNTDLVVTNGYRVWQRNLPLGGNHFTKALSKELKLTLAKAEHLKRNAMASEDPKAVFQAMRPVFNDLLSQVQISVGYFSNVDRTAKIGRIVALGNALKLPGLQRFLAQNLGYEVVPIEQFRGLTGPAVVDAPAFKENVMTFGICYGLCLQGLGRAKLRTNLLPREFLTQRMIRDKKPWAIAAVAALLVGCSINFIGHWWAWSNAHPDGYATAFKSSDGAKAQSGRLGSEYSQSRERFVALDQVGKNLVSNVEGRMLWLELLQAIDNALPTDGQDKPEQIEHRQELHIEQIDCEYFSDASTWFAGVADRWKGNTTPGAEGEEGQAEAGEGAPAVPVNAQAAAPQGAVPPTAPAKPPVPDPTGPGYVIELRGYHYHNWDRQDEGPAFVRRTLLKALNEGTLMLPDGPGGKLVSVTTGELGISHALLATDTRIDDMFSLEDPTADSALPVTSGTPQQPKLSAEQLEQLEGLSPDKIQELKQTYQNSSSAGQPGTGPPSKKLIKLKKFPFVVQFFWKPTPPQERREKRDAAARQNAEGGASTSLRKLPMLAMRFWEDF